MKKETNLEHYKGRLKKILKMGYKDPQTVFHDIKASIDPEIQRTSDFFTSSILDWMAQEYKPELLDYAEKKYLSEVIRPFRKEVNGITKRTDTLRYRDFIRIQVGDDYLTFPHFEKGTRYKGLEYDKTYKPEELGL
jgi:hypothetical protein